MTRRNKYGAKERYFEGQRFASGHELTRWLLLRERERRGEISELKRQVRYELAPSVRIAGEKRARPALRFTVDFQYIEDGELVVDDAKGKPDTAFRIRQHLMKSVHNIDVRLS